MLFEVHVLGILSKLALGLTVEEMEGWVDQGVRESEREWQGSKVDMWWGRRAEKRETRLLVER